jgi:hypothetical protein
MSLTFDEALSLHREVCVLDLHADTAKLMDKMGYDVAERHERPLPTRANLVGHVDLPRLRDGGVAGQFFSFWTVPYPERGCNRGVHSQLDAIDQAIAKAIWPLSSHFLDEEFAILDSCIFRPMRLANQPKVAVPTATLV